MSLYTETAVAALAFVVCFASSGWISYLMMRPLLIQKTTEVKQEK